MRVALLALLLAGCAAPTAGTATSETRIDLSGAKFGDTTTLTLTVTVTPSSGAEQKADAKADIKADATVPIK